MSAAVNIVGTGGASPWTAERVADMWAALGSSLPAAHRIRRDLHREPDLSGHEEATLNLLTRVLDLGTHALVAGGSIIRIGDPRGAAIGLRAELDALPITEATGLPWASSNGAMHACGHDVHMAALVAVLQAIDSVGPFLPVLGILQPREETVPSGAPDLLASPQMEAPLVSHVIGAHVQPRLPEGTFSAAGGAINAAVDDFEICIKAAGGHAGYPHTTGDPILAAASIVSALQGIVARGIDPTHPAVITVGSMNAGRSPNVIPSQATLTGTIRSFAPADREFLSGRLAMLVRSLCETYGCSAELHIAAGEPILVNDFDLARAASRWISGSTDLSEVEPLRTCGADDFAFYCERFPSLMIFVGVGTEDGPGLHHEQFAPPDSAVDAVAATLMAGYLAACEMRLGRHHA